MKKSTIIKGFSGLTYLEQRELLEKLKLQLSDSKPIIEHKPQIKNCVHCSSDKIYKHGVYKNGGRRYHCQSCKKSFNELTGTSIHCIKKKELWDRFIELMLESKSIRYISKDLGINMKTVFDWRHKLLTAFDTVFKKKFKDVVETDEVFFKFNQKGLTKNKIRKKRKGHNVSVLFTMDRHKTYDIKLVKVGNLDRKSLDMVIDKSRFDKDNVICSDSGKIFLGLFEEMKLAHKTFKTSHKVFSAGGAYHVNNLNNLIGRTRVWIRYNFHSVSTKYLNNYMNWFVMLQILKHKEGRNNKFWDYALMDSKAFERNKTVEDNYTKMLELSGVA